MPREGAATSHHPASPPEAAFHPAICAWGLVCFSFIYQKHPRSQPFILSHGWDDWCRVSAAVCFAFEPLQTFTPGNCHCSRTSSVFIHWGASPELLEIALVTKDECFKVFQTGKRLRPLKMMKSPSKHNCLHFCGWLREQFSFEGPFGAWSAASLCLDCLVLFSARDFCTLCLP